MDTKHHILFALNETINRNKSRPGGGGNIFEYHFDPRTGQPESVSVIPTLCPNPSYLSLSADGRYMRLIYRVEKRDNDWKISDFRSIYESDTLRPEIPGTDLHLDRDILVSLRHSYRYLAYVDGKENTSQELVGIDRPEQVEALYAELEEWLNSCI